MKKALALVILTLFIITGCGKPSQTTTIEPTPTTAIPISTSTDIIIDGPWTSLPENSDSGLAIDPELGAVTLKTDPANLVFVTQPDQSKDAFTNSIYSLGSYQGRLYLGYGDTTNNQGPLDIISYDPATGTLLQEMKDIPEEMVGNWSVGENNRFFTSGMDAREPWAFGNFYYTDGFGWRKLRTLYRGLHVMGMLEFQGRLYAQIRSDGKFIVEYPFILVSSNRGLTWEYEKLEEVDAQDTFISDMTSVHFSTGEGLCVIAQMNLFSQSPFDRLYCFDGQTWHVINSDTVGGGSFPLYLRAFQDLLLIEFSFMDSQTGKWTISTFSWDGKDLVEIPYLRDRSFISSQLFEQDGWLYAILPPAGPQSGISSYSLARTRDLQKWEELGPAALSAGVTPQVLIFSHDRLYLGAQNSWREITGNPPVYFFQTTQIESLAGATLTWDAELPTGASLSIQIKAGKIPKTSQEYKAYTNSPFLGPDGTPNTAYTTSGQSLPASQQNATQFQVSVSKTPNSSGKFPVVRSVTLNLKDGSKTFAVDTGSGLYTAANVSDNASFTSAVFELKAPISGGAIFFDARIPEGTQVTFQVRTGKTRAELESASFAGPDGSKDTFYTSSGSPIWQGSDGHLFIQYRAFLASTNPGMAPLLKQVTLVNRKDILDHLDISLSETGGWIAGKSYPVQVTTRSLDGQVVAINGELPLIIKNQTQQGSSLLSPQVVQLTNGEASVDISLFQAIPSQICVQLANATGCSEEVDVQPAGADWFNVEAPDLPVPGPFISPHTEVGSPFSIVVTAMDHYNNIVRDYTGSIHCEIWKWKATEPLAVPAYSFIAADKGSHRFESALSFSNLGEYSLVCLDNANPQIGGALAITAGEFDQAIFP
jgi:hypothetical protein